MVAGIVLAFSRHALLASGVVGIAVQIGAVCLMIWARLVFGRRSFHAAANPTSGGLVTTGPYRFVRHPIYAAATYFVWAGALENRVPMAMVGALLVTAGAGLRMFAEERLLNTMYPHYQAYASHTARIVPFLI